MDESACREIVERLLGPLTEATGLEHWDIRVTFRLRDHEDAAGQCTPNASYEHAHIELDPEAFDGPRKVLRVLVHELVHVLLSPMRVYRTAYVTPDTDGTDEAERENRQWRHFEEVTVINVERLFRGLGGVDKFLPLAEGKVVAVKRVTPDPNVARVRKAAKPKGRRSR